MRFGDRFTEFHLDVLKEIGNIGAGNAATSLSRLLDRKINMHVPSVNLIGFDEVMELAGGHEKEVVGVFLKIHGEAPGTMFFILSPAQSVQFIRQLTGNTNIHLDGTLDDELSRSALQELGNILSGAYLSALADFTLMDLHPSVPSLAKDMVGSILGIGLIELSRVSDQAIVIETSLTELSEEEDHSIQGHFFLFPDPEAYNKFFQALGVTANG
ncbi:chemotaxis protein CheC [Halobacillus sp. BBL2006]|uniref:chemotaxis protein CheC n=1 Tax=Halobacillus sp. BBL2006 TaxID=1543706 RepID=UPI000542A448|nr:chemotaxis protein CheC [Halobacillus sp. BBL2006]KHE71278.1 chemotaxis protein CheY [Halobacillus sp. BBL2006]